MAQRVSWTTRPGCPNLIVLRRIPTPDPKFTHTPSVSSSSDSLFPSPPPAKIRKLSSSSSARSPSASSPPSQSSFSISPDYLTPLPPPLSPLPLPPSPASPTTLSTFSISPRYLNLLPPPLSPLPPSPPRRGSAASPTAKASEQTSSPHALQLSFSVLPSSFVLDVEPAAPHRAPRTNPGPSSAPHRAPRTSPGPSSAPPSGPSSSPLCAPRTNPVFSSVPHSTPAAPLFPGPKPDWVERMEAWERERALDWRHWKRSCTPSQSPLEEKHYYSFYFDFEKK